MLSKPQQLKTRSISPSINKIICKINNNGKIKHINIDKNITLKQLKEIIINKYENDDNKIITSNEVKPLNKKANIFYKGKELINDEQIIDKIIIRENDIDEIDLSVIILSLNDSTFIDENKTTEKLIQNVTKECSLHKGNRELYICVTCNVSFCQKCSKSHASHEILEKKNLINFKNELKILDKELSQSLNESDFSSIYEIKNNNEKNKNNYECNNNLDKLQYRLDKVKQLHKDIINKYRNDIDKILPYLLEYKEKIEQLIEKSYQLDTIKNEQEFIDYYYWFINIKQKKDVINQELQNLQKKKQIFKEMIEEFDNKLKKILINTDDDYKSIKYYDYNYYFDNQFRKNSSSFISSENSLLNKNIISSNNISNSNNTPLKLNLFYLLNNNSININNNIKTKKSSKELNEILKNDRYKDLNYFGKKRHYSNRFPKKIDFFEKIEEKTESEIDETLEEKNAIIIYNIKPKTKNIYSFNFDTKKIDEIKLNFNNISINTFDLCHAILNYKNDLYISGGTDSPNLFCKYSSHNNNNKNIIKLQDIPSPHSSHGILSLKSNIYIVSGSNSKKVEKYNLIENNWENICDLNECHIWPSCLGYKNRYIYVFGGLFNKNKNNNEYEENIFIEKMDINDIMNKWELIFFNNSSKIRIPFSFGIININDYILFIGGKYSTENNSHNNYNCKLFINEKKIEKEEEFKQIENIEFNGKIFYNFGNNYYGDFSSSNYGTFYLINSLEKTIEEFS